MTIKMKATMKAAFSGAVLGMIPVVQVSFAQQVVDPNAANGNRSTMAQSLNGTAVQNIATPNAGGLSHNQFNTFNVGTGGLVINNSSVNVISNIGGAVVANPNLANGQARLILNEVTSGNRSILQGTQELVGGRAAYILANPNGISCDGCGFINFPRATLTTGAPLFQNGTLSGFGVAGGDVSIGEGGLNALGADLFDIITRSVAINGQINANDLSLRLGSNDVDYATLQATARPGTGLAPTFALDSSALGGMYAGRISLIGTEAGVGVRMLGNMAASVSDIDLDVNGRITFKDNVVGAQRNLRIRSAQLAAAPGAEIELDNVQLSAIEQLRLEGGDVQIGGGKTVAGTDLAVDAASLQSTGAQIEARRDLAITTTGATELNGGTVQANNDLSVTAGALTLDAGAKLMGEADGVGPAGATTVDVTGALNVTDGSLFSGAALDVTAGSLNVAAASNAGGAKGVRGSGAVNVNATTISNAGLIASETALTLDASGTLTNTGTVYGRTALGVDAGTLDNRQQVESGGALTVDAGTVTNSGKLYGQTGVTLTANILNNSKLVESGAAMTLNVADVNNVSTATSRAELYAIGDLTVQGNHTLDNTATSQQLAAIVSRDGQLRIDSRSGVAGTQQVTNAGGLLFGGTGLSVLVSRMFENKAHAGRRASTFASTGNVLLGGADQAAVENAAQDITITNTDADIEALVGNVHLYTSYLHNTTNNVPVVADSNWQYVGASSFDHDNNPNTAPIGIESDCGTNADHFDKDVVGKVCARWAQTRSQTLVNNDLSPRGRIVAGNDFSAWIEKAAVNYISLISAGRDIHINGGANATFENRAVELRHDKNALVFRYEKGSGIACGSDNDGSFYEFPTCYRKVFVNISPPDVLSTYTVGMASTVQAGGSINVNIGRVNNRSGVRGETPGITTVPGNAPPSGAPTGGTSGPGTGIGTLTGSPFFVPSSNPTSPYLFETDPRLMSLEGLFGSDLFLKSLGLDPTDHLRVGDPYFEQQLLRQQLLAEAGQLFVADGMGSENEQFKYLMENGIAAQGDLQLRVGVALTQEQLANLQKDIVWMVEVEVDGKKALVPQLYLSDATKASLAQGARFVASNINVKTEGEFVNSGAFVASNNLNVDAGTTFTNTGGTLVAGNGLGITAVGDILNQSGTIRGGDVSVVSTEGSIVNETLAVTQRYGDQGNVTLLGTTATIESTGNLNLKAKEDIVSRGAEINAGGNATLDAGRDITLTAIERETFTATQESSRSGGHRTTTTTHENTTSQVGSGLTVGGNLSATAGNNINIEASTVDVTGGGRLDAGNNINIVALAETHKSDTSTATRSWNSSYEQDTTVERTTGAASSVNFGGDLAISSGKDTNIQGSQIAVGGDLNIEKIGGDLNVTTFEEKTTVSSTTKSSSFFGGSAKADAGDNISQSQASASATLYSSSKETVDIDSTTHLRSGIAVGGNLNAGGDAIKGDVNIVGSNIATGGDLTLAAGGNINVLAAEDKTTVEHTSESFSLNVTTSASIDGASAGIGAQYDKSSGTATQTTAQVSGLSAGGNIDINAGGHFTEQGTQVAAGGDIKVEAASITSLAAQNTYSETGESLSVSVGIGVKAETGLGGVVGSFIDDKTNKAGFDMAAASESLNGLDVPDAGSVSLELSVSVNKTKTSSSGNDAVASSFTSGGNTSFKAREGDATFHGTNVEAGGSIDVSADKGSVKLLTADSASQSSKSTTDASVTLGVSGDGTFSGSGSGSEKSESQSSTTQQAASFKAGKDLNITAEKDVTLVGTALEAGGTAAIEAKEGRIDFLAARDTASASSDEVSANASFSANVSGKEGSVGGGGGTMETRESSSTGKAGSLNATNIVLKSKGDITLEGTQVAAAESASIDTQGKLDFKAVESTSSRTAQGASAQVDIEAGATGGGAKVSGSRTDESEQSTTRTGGSLTAKNLTINAGSGVRLEGTQVDVAENASIDTGKGALVIESAVSTHTKKVNNTEVEVGAKANAKEGSGQGSFKMEGAYEDTNKVSNQNATLNIGGKADIQAAGGIQIAGANIDGVGSVIKAGETNLHGAQVSIEQRQDVDQSTKSNVGVSVGVIVPSKKARQEVSDTVQKVRDSDAANTLRNKAGNAATAISNAADSAKTRLSSLGGDDASKAKANSDLAQRQQDRKDSNTADKLANNTAQADRNATRKNAAIDADLAKQNQKADFDRQKADDQAALTRDKALAKLDANATPAQKAAIEDTFRAAQTSNADKAADAKINNAKAAADQRTAVITQQGADKLAAEGKAADSTMRHHEGKADDIGALQADKAAREAAVKADTTKALADSAAQKTRTEADLQSQKQADTAVLTARQEQARQDALVDADTSRTAEQKAAAKEANAKTAQDTIDASRKELAEQKQAHADTERKAELDTRAAQEKAKIDGEQKKQELLAERDLQRDLLVPDQKVRAAITQADAEQATKVQAADKTQGDADKAADANLKKAQETAQDKFDKASKAIEARTDLSAQQKKEQVDAARKTADTEKAKATETADTAKKDAKKTRDDAVAKAQTERDADANVVKAKDEQKTALEQRKKDQVKQAEAEAEHKKQVAALGDAERKALNQAERDAEKARTAIDHNDKMDAATKATKLKETADTLADAREAATQERAREALKKEEARDSSEKKAAIDALDPGLNAADKAAKLQDIDKTFDDRKTARESARNEAVKTAAEQKERAKETAKADFDQREAQAKADLARKTSDDAAKATYDREVNDIDRKLAADKTGKTAEEAKRLEAQAKKEKNAKALERDNAMADSQKKADVERASADAQRAKDEAAFAQKREQAALDAVTPRPADYAARKTEIDQRKTDADKKATDRLAAQTKDFDATAADKKALAERTRRDQDIDADPALTAEQKKQQKQASENTLLADQKRTQVEHDAAKKQMEALLSPTEKAAADAAAAQAEKDGDRVKNPYALNARLKPYATKAKRWKEVLTSVGVDVDRRAPVEEEAADEPATMVDLLALARQFQAGEQPQALQLLRDPSVQSAAAITAAVDALRDEARDELRKTLQETYTGKALGVLTVAQQREALRDLGVELADPLPAAEVTRRFNAHLDAAVAGLQPDAAQMAEILEGVGVEVKKGENAAEVYQKVLTDGQAKARERAKDMGLSTAQADALVDRFTP